jgi:hypothetical protein
MIRNTAAIPKRQWPAKLLVVTRNILIVASVIAVAWLGWWWIRYPHVPDVSKTSLDDCNAFMASDDFNRLTHRDRMRFAMATIDKLKEKSFAEIVAMGMKSGGARKASANNVKQLDKADQERIGGAFLDMFLTKFYQQDAAKRTAYLFGMVMMQKSGAAAATAKKMGLPPVEAFKSALAGFVTNLPPHTQAEMGQFMLDISKEQRLLGARSF